MHDLRNRDPQHIHWVEPLGEQGFVTCLDEEFPPRSVEKLTPASGTPGFEVSDIRLRRFLEGPKVLGERSAEAIVRLGRGGFEERVELTIGILGKGCLPRRVHPIEQRCHGRPDRVAPSPDVLGRIGRLQDGDRGSTRLSADVVGQSFQHLGTAFVGDGGGVDEPEAFFPRADGRSGPTGDVLRISAQQGGAERQRFDSPQLQVQLVRHGIDEQVNGVSAPVRIVLALKDVKRLVHGYARPGPGRRSAYGIEEQGRGRHAIPVEARVRSHERVPAVKDLGVGQGIDGAKPGQAIRMPEHPGARAIVDCKRYNPRVEPGPRRVVGN